MNSFVLVFRTRTTSEGPIDPCDPIESESLEFLFEGKKSLFPKEKECFVFVQGHESEFFDQLHTGRLCMINAEDGCAFIHALEEQENPWLDDDQKQVGDEVVSDFLIKCAKHSCPLGVTLLLSACQMEMQYIWQRSNISLDRELAKIVFSPDNTQKHQAILSDCMGKLPERLKQFISHPDSEEAPCELQYSQPVRESSREARSGEEAFSLYTVRMCFSEEEMTPEKHLLFDQSTVFAMRGGDESKAKYATVQNDLRRMAQHWEEKASKGNAAAMTNLAICYASGKGVSSNTQKALQLWQKASEMGNVSSMFNLGMCYYNGIGTEVNKGRAVEVLTHASTLGSNQAKLILGMFYEKGDGVLQNFDTAARYYRAVTGSKVSEYLLQRLQDNRLI